MGKTFEKAIERLLSVPSDYTYNELSSLLKRLGYEEKSKGKTSGSRVLFYNPSNESIIMLHKPHPGSIMPKGTIKNVIKNLKEKEEI